MGEPAQKIFSKNTRPGSSFSIAGSFITLIRGSNESSSFAHRIVAANWRSVPSQNLESTLHYSPGAVSATINNSVSKKDFGGRCNV